MSSTPKLAVTVSLPTKADKTQELEALLTRAYEIIVKKEPLTLHWFAMKYTDHDSSQPQYEVFDTFAEEEGRTVHLNGEVADSIRKNAEQLLSAPPEVKYVNVLASKVTAPKPSREGIKSGLVNGLRAVITAKDGKADDVRKLLTDSVAIVEAESDTYVWFSFEHAGTNRFEVVSFFASESGRNGRLREIGPYFASVEALLSGPPVVGKVEVVGASLRI